MLKRLFFSVMVVFFCTNLFAGNPFGNALHLNGNQQYFEIPDRAYLNLDGKRDFTIEFWFKTNGSEPYNLFNKLFVGSGAFYRYPFHGWFVNINCVGPRFLDKIDTKTLEPVLIGCFDVKPYPGAIRFHYGQKIEEGGWKENWRTSCCTVINKEWQHIAITIDINNDKEKIYFDGSGGGSDWSSYLERGIGTPGIPLNIGGLPIAIDTTLDISFYFNGLIDEVRIWSVARTSSQIQSTMNDTLSPEYYSTLDSGLVAYYRFEQMENLGIGEDDLPDDIRDLSLYWTHGDLIGNPDLLDSDILTSIETEIVDIPESYEILQNYPNPFNPWTTLFYRLPKSTFVTLKVYDILGKEIETLVSKHQPEGVYEVTWNAKNLPSGLYICRLQTEGLVKSLKMLLQR